MPDLRQFAAVLLLAASALGLAGCGGNKVLEEPRVLTLVRPLASSADERLELYLDWVVVRDGPGTWVRNANWDQYLLRVRNSSADRLRITRAVLYDAQNIPVEPGAVPKTLTRASLDISRRYRDAELHVKAGVSGPGLAGAGYAAGIVGVELGAVVVAGGAGAGAAGVAIGAMAVAPVLIVGGVVKSYQEDRVAREMIQRHTPFPYDIDPATQQSINWFFPIAPSPQRLELTYADPAGEHTLVLHTREALLGLHIGDGQEQQEQ